MALQVGCSKISAARCIEQVLDSLEVEKERVAARTGEEGVWARFDDVGFWVEGNLGIDDDLRPNSFHRARFRTFCHKDVYGLLTVLRGREYVADRDIRQAISVVVNVEAVDGVGVERVGGRICVENNHGPRRINRRLKCVEVAEVESLVPQRWTKIEPSKMVRHFLSPLSRDSRYRPIVALMAASVEPPVSLARLVILSGKLTLAILVLQGPCAIPALKN